MANQDLLGAVTDRVLWLLRAHCKHATKSRRITFESLPLDNDMLFEGTPLRRLMSPPVPAEGVETEQLFDIWVWPLFSGEGDSVADLSEVSPQLCKFVTQGADLGERTTRLLYALGNAEGARLAWDGAAIMVHHGEQSYGIIDGVVRSRFCTGANVTTDHRSHLTSTAMVRSFNPDFISLYREAYRRGRGLPDVLVALHTGQPEFDFKHMAGLATASRVPSRQQMEMLVRLLSLARDPISAIYKQLVPKWMTTGQFNAVICRLGQRPLGDNINRQLYINKLYQHFHKEEQ